MIPETTVTDLPEFLGAIKGAVQGLRTPDLWWRGHANTTWSLRPSVFRDSAKGAAWEQNIALRFRRGAPTRHTRCPQPDDFPAWLQLMQHYRLPTRLLDWSMSPLTALYFAAERDPGSAAGSDTDSAVWVLSPSLLNQAQAGTKQVFNPADPTVEKLIAPAFNQRASSPAKFVATLGDEIDLRMSVQLAAFTIHGSPAALETLDGAESFLRKIVIPAPDKPGMRGGVFMLGIRRSTLFPDLENLAADLAWQDFDPL